MPVEQVGKSTTYYRIEVAGRLDAEWAGWFGNMTLAFEHKADGATLTVLSGPIADRAELFGILSRIRDLGLRLISVNPIEPVW